MLLNKAILSLAKLCPKDETRYTLNAIAIQKDVAAVTNGHYLVTVAQAQGADDSAYPVTPNLAHRTIKDNETVLVSKDAALAALKSIPKKSTIPILQYAAMSEDGKLITNDLDTVAQFNHKMDGQFPNWRQVVPDAEVAFEISLDARYLKSLAEYFIANGNERMPAVRITLYKDDAPSKFDKGRRNPRAVRFDGRTEDGQDITAILMPVRAENEQFAMRPDQKRAAEAAKAANEAAKIAQANEELSEVEAG